MHTQPASTALVVSRKHLPDALESFGLQSSQQTSTSLTVPTQTRSTWQEAEPTCWWWPQRGLTLGTEAGASHPQCKGLALLRTLWQAVYLVNSTASCSKTLIRTSFCMWCIRNITCSWLPQSSLVHWHEIQAYSLILLLPMAALACRVVIAEHHGCVAAAEGAASHRGERFLLRVHTIPAPGKKAPGETSRSLVPQLPNPYPRWGLTWTRVWCTEDGHRLKKSTKWGVRRSNRDLFFP